MSAALYKAVIPLVMAQLSAALDAEQATRNQPKMFQEYEHVVQTHSAWLKVLNALMDEMPDLSTVQPSGDPKP